MFQTGQGVEFKKQNYGLQNRIKSWVKSKGYFRTTTAQFGSGFGIVLS